MELFCDNSNRLFTKTVFHSASLSDFLKKEILTQVFSHELCKTFKSNFFTEHFWRTSSVVEDACLFTMTCLNYFAIRYFLEFLFVFQNARKSNFFIRLHSKKTFRKNRLNILTQTWQADKLERPFTFFLTNSFCYIFS